MFLKSAVLLIGQGIDRLYGGFYRNFSVYASCLLCLTQILRENELITLEFFK
jgi:hypothetical protein